MKIYLISFVFTALMPFLAQARNSTEERTAADVPLVGGGLSINHIITQDRIITGVLETGIDSRLPEARTAIFRVSQDVFGYHGRNILVPRDARLICDYEGVVAFRCKHIIADAQRAAIYQIVYAQDEASKVHYPLLEKNGGMAFIAEGAAAFIVRGKEDGASASAAQEAAANLSERFGEITAQVLEQTIDLKPAISIPQGTRLQLRPGDDWYINGRK